MPTNKDAYLRFVEEIYQHDAYHSLLIEGYSVTPALIERVGRETGILIIMMMIARTATPWQRAATGKRFSLSKRRLRKVINGTNPGALVRMAHKDWYRELFQPCVAAGLIRAGALAGYRNEAVHLRTSRYVPPKWEVAVGKWIDGEQHQSGHAARTKLTKVCELAILSNMATHFFEALVGRPLSEG